MSTITAPTAERADAPNKVKRKRQPNIYSRYVGTMLYFMGAALIAGGVVHYPLDPQLYTIICVVGAFVFLLGMIVNEFILAPERPALGRAAALVTFSLLLSFGVGMVGGGIQHFTQFPDRSAAMTPIGMLLSYAAFIAKDSEGRLRHLFSLFAAGFAAVTVLTWLGMSVLANTIEPAGHDHGTSQTPAEETPQDNAPAEPQNHDAPTEPEPALPDDEHGSHSH